MGFDYALADFVPFRDLKELSRVRAIPRSEITVHASPHFEIRVIDDATNFYAAMATDLVARIVQAREEERRFVAIVPVGPMPQYAIAAEMIASMRLSLEHVHLFFMDEYADQDGNTAPVDWEGSFQRAARERFLQLIPAELRPPEGQVNFPTREALPDYSQRLADLGGADVCYGGIGWGGHMAFWEPQLGDEFGDDHDAYRNAGARLVELHPMTIMQNALHSFSGDWSWVPPKANTVGPADILGARHRSFWLDGYLGGGVSWQRLIARLVAHGPVNTYVPGSFLQERPTTFTLLGGVADDVVIQMS